MRTLVGIGFVATLLLAGAGTPRAWSFEGPAPRVVYSWPAGGTIVDPFRPPPHRYGPGNRGIEMQTVFRAAVRAPAIGVVTFAGPVAGTNWVVIAHADGIRTTLGRLDEVLVTEGMTVDPSTVVGASSGQLYFGARAGEEYVDPIRLLQPDPRPWLVAVAS